MAIFFDGFDQFKDATDLPDLIGRAGYQVGGFVATAEGHKTGGCSLAFSQSDLRRDWVFSGDTLSLGTAVFMGARCGLIQLIAGASSVTVWASPTTGLMNLNTEAGYVIPGLNRWYYLEVEANKTTGLVTLYVNGKADVTLAMPAEMQSASTVTVRLRPYDYLANDAGSASFDDFYLFDGARLTPVQVATRFPTSQQQADWQVMSEDPMDNWEAVGTLPVDLLNRFIYSNADGAADRYQSNATLPDNNPVLYVGAITLLRKASSDPVSVTVNVGADTQELTSIARDWEYRYSVFDGTGYDKSSVESAVFGVTLNNGA